MSAFVEFQRSAFPACAKKAEEVVDSAYGRLQSAGGWDHVAWREAHGFGSMLAAAALYLGGESVRAVQLLDMALILGAPPDVVQPLLAEADTAARLKLATVPLEAEEEAAARAIQSAGPGALQVRSLRAERRVPGSGSDAPPPPHPPPAVAQIPDALREDQAPRWSGDALPTHTVPAAGLTVDAFRPFYAAGQPVRMPGLAKGWPACRKWASLAFWAREFGHRTVPLEIGRHHDAVWREEPLSLRRFVADYLLPSNRAGRGARVGDGAGAGLAEGGTPSRLASVLPLDLPLERVAYLAQHALCDQLPELQQDFEVPAPCHVGELTRINVWFGTQETVTPLHFDGYDNVIVQVAGFKYVRLYDHDQTPLLYVKAGARGSAGAGGEEGAGDGGGTTAQGNISQVPAAVAARGGGCDTPAPTRP